MQIDEALRSQSQNAALLDAAVSNLDLNQCVEFQVYSRSVLPLDGYVFWLPGPVIKAHGAFHHFQQLLQNEDETLGLADVTFTTLERIPEFDALPVNTIYVARFGDFRYAFSRQRGYFSPMSMWHYAGQSVYPAMASQLLDDPASIDPSKAVVSNSLPIWLAFNGYKSPYVGGFSNPVTLYPSFAVPANLPPPYGSVHIDPASTLAMQNFPQLQVVQVPSLDADGNPVTDSSGDIVTVPTRVMSQLMADKVRIVLYGLQNDAALQFYGALLEYIGVCGPMGLMSTPALRDGKRTQVELQALAMQKIMEMEVSYAQGYAYAVARQTIASATIQIMLNAAA